MSAHSHELARHPEGQRQQWDGVAAGWNKWWRTIETGAECVSQRMVDLAEVKPGQRVLDLATGIGEPALLAASRVGSSGRVVATDLSSRMLAIARERAAALGRTNVEFVAVDAERLAFPDGSFDAILCRWGLTSLHTPMNALVAIRRMLTPGGSFATSVWEAGSRGRPLASLATAVAREILDAASPHPGAPALPGATQQALEESMIHAGFTDIRAEEVPLTLDFPSTDDCMQYLRDVSPELATLLSDKSSGQQEEYRRSLAEGLRPYVMDDGSVRIPNVSICAVGRR